MLTKDELPLSVRRWQCPSCQQANDRDINASINILQHADKVLTHQ
ncbi:transposase [Psychrobacter lutiphocae]